jgi:hypothetical protein
MTADELADHLVEHFNAIEEPLVAFEAANPAEITEAEKERSDFGVYVIPNSESETAFDRGDTCDERRVVSVIVNGPVRGNVTKAVAMKFSEQLRLSLRETQFDGHRWAGNETTTLIDYGALKTKAQFLSRFDATYYTVA